MKCKIKEIDRVYLACLIDSEGCICLAYGNKNKQILRPIINISNTDKFILNWAYNIIRRGWISHTPKVLHHKVLYIYSIGSKRDAIYVLNIILPYLKIKKQQAQLLLEFCKNHEHGKYTNRDFEIFNKIKFLNKRGVDEY